LNAFKGIASSHATGLSAVAGGIAEALVTTAFGLLVAVPAVWLTTISPTKWKPLTSRWTTPPWSFINYFILRRGAKK